MAIEKTLKANPEMGVEDLVKMALRSLWIAQTNLTRKIESRCCKYGTAILADGPFLDVIFR
jgi:hypothetical protein